MHDFVWPAHVPRREDMWHVGLLRRLRHHLALLRFHPRCPKGEPIRIRFPTQRLQDLLRLNAPLLSFL